MEHGVIHVDPDILSDRETRRMHQVPRALWMVVLADVVATYVYSFATYEVLPRSPVSEPATYFLAQPWVYALIAPVAAVAAWRGARQVLDAWAARVRWWRLTLE